MRDAAAFAFAAEHAALNEYFRVAACACVGYMKFSDNFTLYDPAARADKANNFFEPGFFSTRMLCGSGFSMGVAPTDPCLSGLLVSSDRRR